MQAARGKRRGQGVLLCAALAAAQCAYANPGELAALPDDLTQLSLDDLLQIDVTTVSKRAEPLHEAAAAVFVLTGEDIRRSGARSIAEALRLVPGLHVARQGQSYAISARGFNSTSADKLEVLLDGRSVYTPLFSGVFWDALDTYLPDIDRIEVIRGPGATLWGANAVNGVINIVTRPAADTQGVEAVAAGGAPHGASGAARGGWKLGTAGHVRAYAQAREDDNGVLRNGDEGSEGLRSRQAGFRADLAGSGQHRYALSGDVLRGESEGATGETEFNGANLHGRWNLATSADSGWSAEARYEHSRRQIPTLFDERRDTFGLELEHRRNLGPRHALLFGAGYRNSRDDTGGPPLAIIFDPASRTLETYSAFVQDQISLAGGDGALTLGSKFEHNDFTGFEFQPGVRLGWKLPKDVFTWGAVSRAVRTPNRLDSDISIFCPPPNGFPGICGGGELLRIGNPDLEPETLIAYEWGLRLRPARRVSLDLALYYNRYNDLRSVEPARPFGAFGNGLHGNSMGGELTLGWRPLDTLRLDAFYSHMDLDIERHDNGRDLTTPTQIEQGNPRHMGGLRAGWTPAPRWSLDGFLRVVDKLPRYNIPTYTELNLRLAFRLRPDLELALVGENLLDDRHPEFGADNASRVEVQRQGVLQVRWSPR